LDRANHDSLSRPHADGASAVDCGGLACARPVVLARTISRAFADALVGLIRDPWQPYVGAGIHRCELCRITGGPTHFHHLGCSIPLGQRNLFVPCEGGTFVAPSLIAHHVDAHEYAPPDIFREAVLSCPPMRSMQYLKAILKNGPPGFTNGAVPY
jgi:hypothetical protein